MSYQSNPSSLEWVANMDVNVEPTRGRKSTIIGTIGTYNNNIPFIHQ